MLQYGYAGGRILRVDLTRAEVHVEEIEEDITRKYVGGVGLAAKILAEETTEKTDPLSAENPFMVMSGPCTGTIIPTSGRASIAALSPLTGSWGETHIGGSIGAVMKMAGFDGIVVKGISEQPVYLYVDSEICEIRDARHLWGRDTYETDFLLLKETSPAASVLTIGPAGEKLVKFASIVNEGKTGRAGARSGLGAVMGSKKFKAIVCRGNKAISIYDPSKLKSMLKTGYRNMPSEGEIAANFRNHAKRLWDEGLVAVKNFSSERFDIFRERWFDSFGGFKGKQSLYHCRSCNPSCIESKMANGYRELGFAIATFGPLCGIDDADFTLKAYHIADRYGMDVASLGATIAFTMEAYEKGWISKEELGLDLVFGNKEALLEAIRRIGEREEFFTLLGEGVKKLAEKLGPAAQEIAPHSKGLEFVFGDPRALSTLSLECATGNRGGDHLSGWTIRARLLGDKVGFNPNDAFAIEGSGRMAAWAQNLSCMLDSLVVCKFLVGTTTTGQIIQPSELVEWLNCVTGWDMHEAEFLKTGERIFNLKRLINIRKGVSRKDDTLPVRFLREGRGKGPCPEFTPPLNVMLNEYYQYRGWTPDGKPTLEKLKELDLLAYSPMLES